MTLLLNTQVLTWLHSKWEIHVLFFARYVHKASFPFIDAAKVWQVFAVIFLTAVPVPAPAGFKGGAQTLRDTGSLVTAADATCQLRRDYALWKTSFLLQRRASGPTLWAPKEKEYTFPLPRSKNTKTTKQ